MNVVFLVVVAFVGYILAYRLYGRYLARRIFRLSDTAITPAHKCEDGCDYVPTRKGILFGHHFTTIAGVGPIVGPAIGVIWGWVPALLWVFLGSIFVGAVHDFGALVISARKEGRTIGEASKEILGSRVRIMFLLIIFVLLLIVLAVFVFIIALLFQMYPQSVFPVWVEIPIALWLGYSIYRRKRKVWLVGTLAVVMMYVGVFIGVHFPLAFDYAEGVLVEAPDQASLQEAWRRLDAGERPEDVKVDGVVAKYGVFFPKAAGAPPAVKMDSLLRNGVPLKSGEKTEVKELKKETEDGVEVRYQQFKVRRTRLFVKLPSITIWIILLLIYIYIASTLPVHWLLQPRDYINSHELYIAMALIGIGLLVAAPAVVAPPLRLSVPDAPMPFLPFLFVVIACGAVSGFHSLAASGTTVRQMDKETDALPIGYGAMLLEAVLATLVIAACIAGFRSEAAWMAHYGTWSAAGGLGAKLGAFVQGSSSFLGTLGIPVSLASTIIAVLIVSFGATTLDSAARIQRYVISELASDLRLNFLTKVHPATVAAIGSAAILALYKGGGGGGMLLWPVFGTANQLLGGLVLIVITVYLLRRGVSVLPALLPTGFLLVMTTWALLHKIVEFSGVAEGKRADVPLLVIALAILALEVWMIVEAIRVVRERRKK